MAEKTYVCEGCGGIMVWDPKTQKLKCPNCDNVMDLEKGTENIVEHKLTLGDKKKVTAKEKESHTMECKSCGAQMEIGGNETAAQCPYCGSDYVLADKQQDVLTPDGVIPFKLDKNGVNEKFRTWIGGRWLAPSALKHLYQGEGFQGVYVPYWTFDADCDCPYTGEGGKRREEKYKDSEGKEQTRTVVDWYPTRGQLHHFFDDVQTPASVRFRGGLLSGLEPYDFKQLESYKSEYISGYLSENYSIGLEDGHQAAKSKMESELHSMASREIHRQYDEARNIHLNPHYKDETYKYLLVPVYSTAYHFNGKNYAVVINGQNGKVCGEYPKSAAKIIALIVAILAVVIGLWFAFGRKKAEAATVDSQTCIEMSVDADSLVEVEEVE